MNSTSSVRFAIKLSVRRVKVKTDRREKIRYQREGQYYTKHTRLKGVGQGKRRDGKGQDGGMGREGGNRIKKSF
jgi:hypothetical protein